MKDPHLKTTGEIDFLIISLPLKSIVHIEAKRANTVNSRNSAGKQLERGLTFFKENFPFPANWKYIKMLAFGEVVQDICSRCQPLVLSTNFIESNQTQPVAEEIANQFKFIWKNFEVWEGKICYRNFLQNFIDKTCDVLVLLPKMEINQISKNNREYREGR
jgi:hypothetical protein